MSTVDKVNDNGSVYDIADSTARGTATNAETLAGEAKALATTANNKLKFNAKSEFPVEGTSSTLYIATDENKIYVWNSTNSEYDELTSSVDTTEIENRLTELEEDNVDIKNDIEDIEDKIVDLKAIKSGTLPISFTADDETEIPFTIYGNNEINNTTITGTLPLTFTTHTAGAADTWSISGNDKVGKNIFEIIPADQIITETGTMTFVTDAESGMITANGTTGSTESNVKQRFIVTSELAGDYYFSGSFNQTGSLSTFDAYMYDQTAHGFIKKWDGTTTSPTIKDTESQEVKLIEGHTVELTFRTFKNTSVNNLVFKPMVRPANTSSDFEPYQRGVGQRTKNLFEITGDDTYTYRGVTFVRDKVNKTIVANGQATGNVFYGCGDITLKAGIQYILTGCPAGGSYSSPMTYIIYAMGHSDWGYDTGNGVVLPIMTEDTVITPRIGIYPGAGLFTNLVFKPEVKKVGYQVPITVSQAGQTDKNYDIYIGDSPLTEGETVSKQSTGIDIELFEGENTVSTTLYNKPETSITYPEYIGVGEYENGQWQIPLTLNDSDIIVPIDAPLVEGESVNGTFTSVIGNNTLDTTLSNKPNADIDLGSRINIIENNLTTINDRLTNTENKITAFDEGESVETSNLPITFTSNGGEISYTIYGKDAHNSLSSDTLPLIFTTAVEQNAIDWIIYGNNNPGTRNLFNKDGELTADTILKSDGTTDTDINFKVSDFISVDTDTDYTLKWNSDTLETATTASICFYNINQEYISGETYSTNNIVTVTTPEDCRFVKVSVSNDYLNNTMFVKGEIAPNTFIPYQMGVGEYNQDGYYIPIDISQDGQTTVHMDIYVGNSPLVEGDSVSKTSTNINIPLFKGENNISTTLLNKPITNVKYTDYLGVGEYVNSQWQIPLTITCGNEQTTYNIPIDAPLTDGETVSDTVEITAYEGENVLDTSLTIKPDVKIEYTYNNKINVIDSKVKAIDSEVKAIENNIKAINSNVNALVDKINSSNTDIATLSSYISTMSEQITTMAADIEELKSKSNPVNGYVPISVNSFMSTNTTVEEVTE